MRQAFIVLIALALGGAAFAAQAPVSPAPAPPRANPEAQARMQALIDKTPNAAAAFRADAYGAIVHIQSGMKCTNIVGEGRVLSGLYIAPLIPVGEDVGCDWHSGEVKLSVFVTRLGATPIADYARDTVAAIRALYTVTGAERPVRAFANTAFGPPYAGGVPVTVNGKPFIASWCVAEERGWAVKVRALYPAGDSQAEVSAGTRCSTARQDIHDFTPANARSGDAH